MFRSILADDNRRDAILLTLILLLLGLLLLRNAALPLLDRHSWRQCDTASFARGIARGQYGLHPQFIAYYPDEFGLDGRTECEFNFYPWIVAMLARLLGQVESQGGLDLIARLVSSAFSLGTAVWIYLFGRRLIDRRAGLLAAFCLCLSPLYLFYGRSVQPDATTLCLTLGTLYLFVCWLDSERWVTLCVGAMLGALAILTKLPALYVGLPLFFAAWYKRGWRFLSDWRIWLYGALLILPAIAYYASAHMVWRQTGLTVYGINGGWPGSGKFSLWQELTSRDFYRIMLNRLRGIILGPWGFWLFLLGLVVRPLRRDQALLYVWLAAVVLFILGVAQGNRQHEYYQLPLVPVAALFMGRALSAFLQGRTLHVEFVGLGRRTATVLVALFFLVGIWQAQGQLGPMTAQAEIIRDAADATKRFTPPGEPVAVIHDWARVPELLYYADRRGWVMWLEYTPEGTYDQLIIAERRDDYSLWHVETVLERGIGRINTLAEQGASSLVVTLEQDTADVFLSSQIGRELGDHYDLLASDTHWLIYDLAAHESAKR